MKYPILIMFTALVLTVFSTLYESPTPEPVVSRTISSVEVTADKLCIENDSKWGKAPPTLTKEAICKCYPDQCPKEESYPIEQPLNSH
jgi:hypothetical protein